MNRTLRIASAAAAVLFATTAFAQTDTWNGTSSNWNNGANWSNGTPLSSSTTSLTFGGATWSSSDDIAGGFLLNNLTFDNSGLGTISSTSTANYLNFVSNGATPPSIALDGAGNVTISSSIAVTNNLGISGPGPGALTLSGTVSGAGGLTVNSGAMLTLANTNTFSGGINLSGGTVAFGNYHNLGSTSNAITFNNGGVLSYTATASVDPDDFTFKFPGNGTIAVANPNTYYELEGSLISGSGGLTFAGSGEVLLHSSNSNLTGQIVVANQATMADYSLALPERQRRDRATWRPI